MVTGGNRDRQRRRMLGSKRSTTFHPCQPMIGVADKLVTAAQSYRCARLLPDKPRQVGLMSPKGVLSDNTTIARQNLRSGTTHRIRHAQRIGEREQVRMQDLPSLGVCPGSPRAEKSSKYRSINLPRQSARPSRFGAIRCPVPARPAQTRPNDKSAVQLARRRRCDPTAAPAQAARPAPRGAGHRP